MSVVSSAQASSHTRQPQAGDPEPHGSATISYLDGRIIRLGSSSLHKIMHFVGRHSRDVSRRNPPHLSARRLLPQVLDEWICGQRREQPTDILLIGRANGFFSSICASRLVKALSDTTEIAHRLVGG